MDAQGMVFKIDHTLLLSIVDAKDLKASPIFANENWKRNRRLLNGNNEDIRIIKYGIQIIFNAILTPNFIRNWIILLKGFVIYLKYTVFLCFHFF